MRSVFARVFVVVLLLAATCNVVDGKLKRLNKDDLVFFNQYRTYSQIQKYMKFLAYVKTNATVEHLRIGRSFENRPITALRITGNHLIVPPPPNVAKGKYNKYRTRGILLTAGVHGREWITTSALLYAVTRILEDYGKPENASLTEMLDTTSLHVIPLVNPDGYEYTWKLPNKDARVTRLRFKLGTHDRSKESKLSKTAVPPPLSRLWRPNRRRIGTLYGVDLNRNWGTQHINWGKGVSTVKSMNFQGKNGFSEFETKAVRFYASRITFNAYLDVHCCLQNVKAPFSLNPYNTTTAAKYARLGRKIASAMTTAQNRLHKYAFRPKRNRKYSSGISSGWSLNELGIAASYTVELGGKFILPVDMIAYEGEELLFGILMTMIDASTTTEPNQVHAFVPSMISDNISSWQLWLRTMGYFPKSIGTSMSLGPITMRATRKFQEKEGLKMAMGTYVDIPTIERAIELGYEFIPPKLTQPAKLSNLKRLQDRLLDSQLNGGTLPSSDDPLQEEDTYADEPTKDEFDSKTTETNTDYVAPANPEELIALAQSELEDEQIDRTIDKVIHEEEARGIHEFDLVEAADATAESDAWESSTVFTGTPFIHESGKLKPLLPNLEAFLMLASGVFMLVLSAKQGTLNVWGQRVKTRSIAMVFFGLSLFAIGEQLLDRTV